MLRFEVNLITLDFEVKMTEFEDKFFAPNFLANKDREKQLKVPSCFCSQDAPKYVSGDTEMSISNFDLRSGSHGTLNRPKWSMLLMDIDRCGIV